MKVKVPTSWDDITVGEFQQIAALDVNETPSQRNANIISIVTNIDNPFELDNASTNEIMELLSFMNEDLPKDRLSSFKYNGINYEWIGGFGEIKLGEQISIEQTIEVQELNYHTSFDLVMSVLLREEGKEFNAKDMDKNRSLFSEFPITLVHGMIFFFLNGGNLYLRSSRRFSVVPKMKETTGLKKKKKLMIRLKRKVLLRVLNGLLWLTALLKMILRSTN